MLQILAKEVDGIESQVDDQKLGHADYRIKGEWHRNNFSFTQGFKYIAPYILESTGRPYKSYVQLLKFDKESRLIYPHLRKKLTEPSDFGEGVDLITLNDGQKYVFQLNWQTRDVYIWSWPELGRVQTLRWPIKEYIVTDHYLH